MTSARGVIAVDFGTTNSYFCKCPADQLSPVGVDFGGGRDGLATAILYRQDAPPLVGTFALHEVGEATEAERRRYRLCTQFKPDIAVSEAAYTQARDFLATVLAEARKQYIDLDPAHSETIFGVPSEADERFRETLHRLAAESGFGEVRLLDEPKGALLNHLWRRDFSPSEAQEGVLVIDFGGGTCDFAVMHRLEVRHSWGDMELGGRLFDDLFFQWFAEQNPEAVEPMVAAGDFYYVSTWLCREAKEFFSQTMARDRTATVNKSIGRYGSLRGLTWKDFLQRACHYRPSDLLAETLTAQGVRLKILEHPRPTLDLLGWFRRSLAEGLGRLPQAGKEIRCVILAGGSSLWPFVGDIVQDVLPVAAEQLKRSDRPYAAIAEGLALLPALQRRFGQLRTELRRDLPGFCEQTLGPLVQQVTSTYVEQIAADVTEAFFDRQVRPLLERFRREGGSVAQLRQLIEAQADAFGPELEALVARRAETIRTGLGETVHQAFARWLADHGLSLPRSGLDDPTPLHLTNDWLTRDLPDLYREVVGSLGLAAFLALTVSGAALASGPLGWVLGGLLAAVVSLLAVAYGTDRARRRAEQWQAPGWVTRRLLTPSKIERTGERLRGHLREALAVQAERLQAEFRERLTELVQRQIEALSELSQL